MPIKAASVYDRIPFGRQHLKRSFIVFALHEYVIGVEGRDGKNSYSAGSEDGRYPRQDTYQRKIEHAFYAEAFPAVFAFDGITRRILRPAHKRQFFVRPCGKTEFFIHVKSAKTFHFADGKPVRYSLKFHIIPLSCVLRIGTQGSEGFRPRRTARYSRTA